MTGWRRRMEQQAGPMVVLVSRMPRIVPFLVVAVLLVTGLVVQGVLGAALLLALAGVLLVLLLLSWPALLPAARLLRVAVVALVVVRAVAFLS